MQSNEDALPTPLREKLNAEPQAMLALTVDGIIEAFNPAAATLFEIAEGDRISKLPFTNNSINIVLREIRLTAHRDLPKNPLQWLQNMPCKLYAVIGSHENNSRAKRADRLRNSGVNIKTVMAKGGGDMLFFSHPKLIVDTMVEAWESA